MKRIIALLLALVMVFALCACGKKPSTEEQTVAVMDNGLRIVTGNAVEQAENPFFNILDARLKRYAGKVYFDFLFECLFLGDENSDYPDAFSIWFNFLDKDGIIIDKERFIVKDVRNGDKGWTGAFFSGESNLLFNPDDVNKIEIIRYTAHFSSSSKLEEYYLETPIAFEIDSLEILD